MMESLNEEPVAYHWHVLCRNGSNGKYFLSGQKDPKSWSYACDTVTVCYWPGCHPDMYEEETS